MDDLIRSLDDAKAERLLDAVTRPRRRAGGFETEASPELRRALGEAFGVEPGQDGGGSAAGLRGDLARAALLVLAEDPEVRPILEEMARNPAAEAFAGPLTTTLLITAALVVLQLEADFTRNTDGTYTIKVKLHRTSDALLKPLVQKLLGLLSKGSS